MARITQFYTILSAKAADWVWTTIPVEDYRHATVEIATASSANLTVKAQGAIWDVNETTTVDFSSAASSSNVWDFIQMVDLNDWSPIDWDTWVSFAWTDDVRLLELNVNWVDYINFQVSSYVAWNITVKVKVYDNE